MGICFSLPESRICNGSSRSWKLKETEPDLANHRIGATAYPSFTLPEESALQICSKVDKLTCIIYLQPPAVQDHFGSEVSLSKKKKKKVVSFSAEHTGAISVGLIRRRKEMFKLKTRRFLCNHAKRRKDLKLNIEDKWIGKSWKRGSHLPS